MSVKLSKAIGIDLGTAFSSVAVFHSDQNVEVIPCDSKGGKRLPSVVGFHDTGHVVGDEALAQAGRNPANTIFSAKRLLGARKNDLDVQKDIWRWPYRLDPESENKVRFTVEYKKARLNCVSPEEICAIVLGSLKEAAEKHLGDKVR